MQKYSYLLHWICAGQRFEIRKINSVNPLDIIFNKVNGYFEETNGNKYSMLVPTNESKKQLKNIKNCGLKSEI